MDMPELIRAIAPVIRDHVGERVEDLSAAILAEIDAALEPLRRRLSALEQGDDVAQQARTGPVRPGHATIIAELDKAFASMNLALFDGKLASPALCLHFARVHLGFFRPPSTISLHDDFAALPLSDDCLITLAHEAVHLWRHSHAGAMEKPVESHGGAWAAKMRGLGIDPSTHAIERGGPFERWLAHWRGEVSR